MEVNKMKRNPPQKLLEDGIKLTCLLGAPFLTYKHIIVPHLKPDLEESDREWKSTLDTQPGEGDLYIDSIWATQWLMGRFIMYVIPLAFSYGLGYIAWETIEERYL